MSLSVRHVYLHVPFCRRRCSYCDFAIAVRRTVPGSRFVDVVSREIDRVAGASDIEIGPLETIYVGGGTPSLLATHHLCDLLAKLKRAFGSAENVEITIEANPEDVRSDVAEAWADAGVNRVSLGIQSLDPAVLAWMHRSHSVETALAAPTIIRESGIRSVSIDIIFAVPDRFDADSVADAARLIELAAPDHVSAYGLTVESGTPLARWVERGEIVPAPAERTARDFIRLHELLEDRGYEHYEISNYAREGHRSRHNQVYWSGRPYLGLGPSAHSFDGNRRWWNVREWVAYEERLRAGRSPVGGDELLTADQRLLETLYLGLRVREGLDERDAGPLSAFSVASSIDEGWLVRKGGRLVATPEGWLRLDELATRLSTA